MNFNIKTKNTNNNSSNNNNNNNFFYSNPEDLQFVRDLVKDSPTYNCFDNKFCLFKSINDILILIYINENNSIIFFNLIDDKKVNEIKNAHSKFITSLRHYLDKTNKRDLIISISTDDNNIKLWNVNSYECLYEFKNVNEKGKLYSACFLYDNDQIYIITSHAMWGDEFEFIKVFDLNGNKIKDIEDSKEYTAFIDTYNENKKNKNYIITGNRGYSKSYSYDDNKVYHKYSYNDYNLHNSIIIYNNEEIIYLIELSSSGKIGMWDFHSAELLYIIEINYNLFSICLWNKDYLIIGCGDKTIKLIDIKNRVIKKDIIGHNNYILTIKKVRHPKYGECLISKDMGNNIKLFINKDVIK